MAPSLEPFAAPQGRDSPPCRSWSSAARPRARSPSAPCAAACCRRRTDAAPSTSSDSPSRVTTKALIGLAQHVVGNPDDRRALQKAALEEHLLDLSRTDPNPEDLIIVSRRPTKYRNPSSSIGRNPRVAHLLDVAELRRQKRVWPEYLRGELAAAPSTPWRPWARDGPARRSPPACTGSHPPDHEDLRVGDRLAHRRRTPIQLLGRQVGRAKGLGEAVHQEDPGAGE